MFLSHLLPSGAPGTIKEKNFEKSSNKFFKLVLQYERKESES